MTNAISAIILTGCIIFIFIFGVSTAKDLIVYFKNKKNKNTNNKEVKKDNDGTIK